MVKDRKIDPIFFKPEHLTNLCGETLKKDKYFAYFNKPLYDVNSGYNYYVPNKKINNNNNTSKIIR